MGTVVLRKWVAHIELGTVSIRLDGGDENSSDDAVSGPLISWPVYRKEGVLPEILPVGSRVVSEVEEGENGERMVVNISSEYIGDCGVRDRC